MREIVIVSTLGQRVRRIQSNAKTWGELTEILQNDYSYNLDLLKATETTNKTTLESLGAKLPEGDFKLMLRPTDSKGGAESFAKLRHFVAENPECKTQLTAYGQTYCSKDSWTRLDTLELGAAIEAYKKENTYVDGEVEEIVDNRSESILLSDRLDECISLFSEVRRRINSPFLFDEADIGEVEFRLNTAEDDIHSIIEILTNNELDRNDIIDEIDDLI